MFIPLPPRTQLPHNIPTSELPEHKLSLTFDDWWLPNPESIQHNDEVQKPHDKSGHLTPTPKLDQDHDSSSSKGRVSLGSLYMGPCSQVVQLGQVAGL